MNEDDAFIRAIREQPDDETSRLVYADWLDDRSDPRAEYLRAEAAWAALQPSDEQYRPLYRRVSQLAATLDPEWFAAVSRIGHRARSEWARVAHVWEPHQTKQPTEPIREWSEARQILEETFRELLEPVSIDQRFCLPVDYFAFSTTVGGNWKRNDLSTLFSAMHAAFGSCENMRYYSQRYGSPREMWVCVAGIDTAADFMLCCDLGSARFGGVAECERYRPWMDSHGSELSQRGDTFLQFLVNWSASE